MRCLGVLLAITAVVGIQAFPLRPQFSARQLATDVFETLEVQALIAEYALEDWCIEWLSDPDDLTSSYFLTVE